MGHSDSGLRTPLPLPGLAAPAPWTALPVPCQCWWVGAGVGAWEGGSWVRSSSYPASSLSSPVPAPPFPPCILPCLPPSPQPPPSEGAMESSPEGMRLWQGRRWGLMGQETRHQGWGGCSSPRGPTSNQVGDSVPSGFCAAVSLLCHPG